VIALNDAIADGATSPGSGTSTSSRCSSGSSALVAPASRAAELALACKYGGLRAARSRSSRPRAAPRPRLELTPAGGELDVLPTYTAMLALRRIVAARGHVPQYWERGRMKIRVGHLYPTT
jgi:hypothetical protein